MFPAWCTSGGSVKDVELSLYTFTAPVDDVYNFTSGDVVTLDGSEVLINDDGEGEFDKCAFSLRMTALAASCPPALVLSLPSPQPPTTLLATPCATSRLNGLRGRAHAFGAMDAEGTTTSSQATSAGR